jgi:tetratricopeptide (TPR) repeat protein/TolB-like protein
MSVPEAMRHEPTPDEIRDQVDRIVTSQVFERSPQLGAFLRFVVEAVLHGKRDRIKAYTIGVEVLRRDLKFDPQFDPIVRVEATRLRRAIERYYAGPGADDPVVIDVPRGSYVPIFRRREAEVDPAEIPAEAPPGAPGSARAQRVRSLLIAVACVAILVVAGILLRQDAKQPVASLHPGNGMPILAVDPFDVVGTPEPQGISATTLFGKIQDGFARFDTVNVTSRSQPVAPLENFRLQGAINYLGDTTTTVRLRLVDIGDSTVVWSNTFERLVLTRDRDAIEDSIVLRTAGTLLQPFGVIHARSRVRYLASDAGDQRHRCVIEASESLRSFDPGEHARARTCLERLTSDVSGFVVGLRYLAAIYLREFLYGAGSDLGETPTLDRALRSARRAVELRPEGSRVYNTLASIHLARGEVAPALAASERAIALNKYDMAVLGDFGARLISAGETDRGMILLRRAADAGTVRPATHHFYLFLGHYLKGNMPEAMHEADQLTSDTYQLGLIARSLAARAAGDRERARRAFDGLVALQPAWGKDLPAQLRRFFPSEDIVDRLVRDLAVVSANSRF